VLVAALVGAAQATTFVGVDERSLTRAADAIVVATVAGIETVGDHDGRIRTLITLDVERAYKGDVGRRLTIAEDGGRLGGRVMWIAGSPRFRVGERQLLFLCARRDGPARTTAPGLGQLPRRPHPR